MTNAIETSGLTKDHGSGRGIFDLDLAVREGEAFGFLGQNGAGKTTTIKVLMGVSRATRGTARIFGRDSARDAVALKRRIGHVPGELPQFGGWRGAEIVGYVSGLRGDLPEASVRTIAERLDLDLGRRYREYSHGNKQKLALLLAFAPAPPLLIVDEPTTGLDPLHQQVFHALVREAKARGATIFISSHVLSEVEQVCDRVGIVRDGRLVTVGPLAELAGMKVHHLTIDFAGPVPLERLRAVSGLERLSVDGGQVRGVYRGSFEPLLAALAGSAVRTFASREPSLEEVFLGYYSG